MSKKKNDFLGDQKFLLSKKKGITSKYKELFMGKVSFFTFLKYEFVTTFFSGIPGGLGFFLRKIFFPGLFKSVGKNVIFGKHMTIRHPSKTEIGDNVVFDDNTVLDAKGKDNRGIVVGNNVLIGRNTIISCKGGDIEVGDFSNIGPNNTLISESSMKIGKYVFTAGHSYLIAGGNHSFEKKDIPIWFQPSISKGGIIIEDDIWIGASTTILDGVKIGKGSIIGAASLVLKSIPSFSIAAGSPARVIKKR
ncbi:MAG: acyltransferase [Candidatus Aminicenantes bacterium]|nr:acyltransferase [Candidatus Aminicenantes bacterium]